MPEILRYTALLAGHTIERWSNSTTYSWTSCSIVISSSSPFLQRPSLFLTSPLRPSNLSGPASSIYLRACHPRTFLSPSNARSTPSIFPNICASTCFLARVALDTAFLDQAISPGRVADVSEFTRQLWSDESRSRPRHTPSA